MNILLLNIPYYEKYSGIEDVSLNTYDKFFQEKKGNNPEAYNFQDYNKNCYGYVSVKDGVVDLSKVNLKNDCSILFENCLVIWVSKIDNKNNCRLIGWYKNATVFNYLQKKLSYPTVGRDLYFNIKTKSEDAFLLQIDDRKIISLCFENGNNILVKNTSDMSILNILEFINSYNSPRFNTIYTEKILSQKLENYPNNPISLSKRGAIYMYNENNLLEALKFFNTALLYKNSLNKQDLLNIKYEKAICLQMLNCFDYSINLFNEILEISNYNFNIYKNLMYSYFLIEDYEKAELMCNKILDYEKLSETNCAILEEILCLKSESLIYQNNINSAKKIINDIIKSTKNQILKENCTKILKTL